MRCLLLLCVTALGCGGETFDIAVSETTPLEIDSAAAETAIVADAEPDVVVEEAFADATDDTRVIVDAVSDAATDVAVDVVVDVVGDGVSEASDAKVDGDALVSCDVPIPCYPDADGDGYAPAESKPINACVCGAGFTVRSPAITIDCNDEDSRVHPAATMFYPEAYCVPGTGCATKSFDYNCSGTEEPQVPGPIFAGCTGACVGTAGWSGSVPGCGASGLWVTCKLELTGCKQPTSGAKQACR